VVAVIGLGAWTLGSDLGRVPSPARAVAPSFPQPRQSTGKLTTRVVWSNPPRITSFDPQGDGSEDPGGVGLAVDDDPSTEWTTDTYYGRPNFGGLKQGVGLLLDLRHPTEVSVAQLLLSAPGADFQIRAGSVRPTQPSDLPVVASRTDSPAQVRLSLSSPVRARYWLLWITSLPKAGTGYRLGVAEIALLN
jgi:putative peptidoglycan lipid II flippase